MYKVDDAAGTHPSPGAGELAPIVDARHAALLSAAGSLIITLPEAANTRITERCPSLHVSGAPESRVLLYLLSHAMTRLDRDAHFIPFATMGTG